MSPRRTATAIRFDPDVHERLTAEAEARDVSVNWIVNRLCREGMERMTPLTAMRLTGPGPLCDACMEDLLDEAARSELGSEQP